MNRVVEVPLAEGGSILIEVDEPIDGPVVRGRAGAVALPPLEDTLEHVLSGLGPGDARGVVAAAIAGGRAA